MLCGLEATILMKSQRTSRAQKRPGEEYEVENTPDRHPCDIVADVANTHDHHR